MMGNGLADLVKKSMAAAKAEPGDYWQDGLLHCGKCRTPKQAVVNLLGEDVTVGVRCKCKRDTDEAETAEIRKQKRFYSVMQRLEYCDISIPAKREHCHERVLQYIKDWDKMLESGVGLLLWGDVGTGKSTSAAYIVQELKKRYVPAIMTNFAQFGDVRDELPSFNGVDLLVLDDLGAERQSEFMLERVFEIVDSRARVKKPTIYTTNLSLEDLKNPTDLKNKRLYSRVLERTVPIKFTGPDHREEHAKQTVEWARKRLEGK